MGSIFKNINKNLSAEDIAMLSPLQLAYIGDGVYELFIRTYLLDGKRNVNQMNKLARKLVNAESQAIIVTALEDQLSQKEARIVKRGRNAKIKSSPKNMDIMDYKYATGFEALIGYLYLREEYERLYEIIETSLYASLIYRLEMGVFNLGSMEKDQLKKLIEKFFRKENIAYESLSVEECEEADTDEREINIVMDFSLDISDYKKSTAKYMNSFIECIEGEGLLCGGGGVPKFKEE